MFQIAMNKIVNEILASFRIVACSSVSALKSKEKIVKGTIESDHKTAIIFADPIRCASTLAVAFFYGIKWLVVSPNSGPKTVSQNKLRQFANKNRVNLYEAGELYGRPIRNAILGNSPLFSMQKKAIKNSALHFYCSNLGSVVSNITHLLNKKDNKSNVDGFIANYYNWPNVCDQVLIGSYEKILYLSGGFYGNISFEDFILGGLIISNLSDNFSELDDEAKAMYISSQTIHDKNDLDLLISLNSNNAISKWLSRLGKGDDVEACLDSNIFEEPLRGALHDIVPVMKWIDGIPLFVNERNEL